MKALVIGPAHSQQLLIYALGTISGPPESQPSCSSLDVRQSVEFKKAEAYFLAARKRMGVLFGDSGMIEAQCFFLAGVYLMATLRPFQARPMFVQALVCCEGFHIPLPPNDPRHDENHTLQESIYWTCFKSELSVVAFCENRNIGLTMYLQRTSIGTGSWKYHLLGPDVSRPLPFSSQRS